MTISYWKGMGWFSHGRQTGVMRPEPATRKTVLTPVFLDIHADRAVLFQLDQCVFVSNSGRSRCASSGNRSALALRYSSGKWLGKNPVHAQVQKST